MPEARGPDTLKRPQSAEIDFLWLELTGKCNLRCVHCYSDSGPQLPLIQSMGLNDWSRVIGEAADLSCRNLQFIGGEPSLHPGLPDLIRRAKACGITNVEVYTNGTVLPDNLKC